MALYIRNGDGFELYTGAQLIGSGKARGRFNAQQVEDLWTDQQLTTFGLYKPAQADPEPEGMKTIDYTVAEIDGVVRFIRVLVERPAPAIPQSVTRRQARLALLSAGLLDLVETAIESMDEPARTAAKIEWEDATEIRRDHALIAALAADVELSEEQVDNLFITAAGL